MVGDEFLRWNTILSSLLILGEKLEESGFVYYDTKVNYTEGLAMFNML